MELLHRLYKIASSRLPHSEKGDDPVDSGPGSTDRGPQTRKKQQQPGYSGTRARSAHATQPGQDPQLAAYYANLEIPYGSDLEQVRRAWKRLVRRYHPDLHSADPEKRRVANELTQGLNQAYEELKKRL